jgi:hypothetical protein
VIPPVTVKNEELHGRCGRSDSPKVPSFRAISKNVEMQPTFLTHRISMMVTGSLLSPVARRHHEIVYLTRPKGFTGGKNILRRFGAYQSFRLQIAKLPAHPQIRIANRV